MVSTIVLLLAVTMVVMFVSVVLLAASESALDRQIDLDRALASVPVDGDPLRFERGYSSGVCSDAHAAPKTVTHCVT